MTAPNHIFVQRSSQTVPAGFAGSANSLPEMGLVAFSYSTQLFTFQVRPSNP